MSNDLPFFEVNDNSKPNNPRGVLENWESFKEADREYKFKKNLSAINELGYFGNIWVRSHYLKKQGDTSGDGHYHKFDHISLLTSGSVKVEVDGYPAKEFIAPTFIVIRKDHKHSFTALQDDTVYYCVFALRNVEGEIEDVYGPDVDPLCADAITDQDNARRERLAREKKLLDLETKTTHSD